MINIYCHLSRVPIVNRSCCVFRIFCNGAAATALAPTWRDRGKTPYYAIVVIVVQTIRCVVDALSARFVENHIISTVTPHRISRPWTLLQLTFIEAVAPRLVLVRTFRILFIDCLVGLPPSIGARVLLSAYVVNSASKAKWIGTWAEIYSKRYFWTI